MFTWLPFLWSAGGEIALMELSTGLGQFRVNIVSPGVIAALQFWQDLVQDDSAVLSQPERGFELDRSSRQSGSSNWLFTCERSRDSAAYQQFVEQQPALSVFLNQMTVARSRPIFPGYAQVSENLGRAMEATLLGQTPTEAKASQQRLDLIFDNGP